MRDWYEGKTNEQLAAMTPDEAAGVIDLLCAQQGVPLGIDVEQPKPVNPVPHDRRFFKVQGTETLFGTAEQARAVRDLMVTSERWKVVPSWSSSRRRVGDYEPVDDVPEITEVTGYRGETLHANAARIEAFEARKREWDQQEERRASHTSERSRIAAEVWAVIDGAAHKVREAERLGKLWTRYVRIAGGDQDTAWRFLNEAEELPAGWKPDGYEPAKNADRRDLQTPAEKAIGADAEF